MNTVPWSTPHFTHDTSLVAATAPLATITRVASNTLLSYNKFVSRFKTFPISEAFLKFFLKLNEMSVWSLRTYTTHGIVFQGS